MFKPLIKAGSLCGKNVNGTNKVIVRYYEIPERIKGVIKDPNPSFYRMVEYFYHFAVQVAEPSLFEYLKKHAHFSDKKRKQRVAGILKVPLSIVLPIYYVCMVCRHTDKYPDSNSGRNLLLFKSCHFIRKGLL